MLFLNLYAQETLLLGLDMCHQAVQYQSPLEHTWRLAGSIQLLTLLATVCWKLTYKPT